MREEVTEDYGIREFNYDEAMSEYSKEKEWYSLKPIVSLTDYIQRIDLEEYTMMWDSVLCKSILDSWRRTVSAKYLFLAGGCSVWEWVTCFPTDRISSDRTREYKAYGNLRYIKVVEGVVHKLTSECTR